VIVSRRWAGLARTRSGRYARGIYGLVGALLFGASTALSKLLLPSVALVMLAALRYIRSAILMTIFRLASVVGGEEAEDYLRQAREVARRQAARLFALPATTSLARLLRDTSRRDETRAMLTEIYGRFTEGYDTAVLKDAKALLAELSN